MTTYERHPLSAEYGDMDPEAFAGLRRSMRELGYMGEPIVLFEGAIIDGWHRYQAALSENIAPVIDDLPGHLDPRAYTDATNLHRRHLTASQRAAIVTARAMRTNGAGDELISSSTNDQLAEEAQVSVRTIQHARKAIHAGRMAMSPPSHALPMKPVPMRARP